MIINLVSLADVDEVFQTISARLERGLEKVTADRSVSDYWMMCRRGDAFLITASDGEVKGAIIVQFQAWPHAKVLRILACAGWEMDRWLKDAREYVGMIARHGGATSIITEGRAGWERVFPEAKKLRTIYEVNV